MPTGNHSKNAAQGSKWGSTIQPKPKENIMKSQHVAFSMKVMVIAAAFGVPVTVLASDGKDLYDAYQCANCHGNDARSVGTRKVPPIAGMRANELYTKIIDRQERQSHESVWKSCGETPNQQQVTAIAAYIAALPR